MSKRKLYSANGDLGCFFRARALLVAIGVCHCHGGQLAGQTMVTWEDIVRGKLAFRGKQLARVTGSVTECTGAVVHRRCLNRQRVVDKSVSITAGGWDAVDCEATREMIWTSSAGSRKKPGNGDCG